MDVNQVDINTQDSTEQITNSLDSIQEEPNPPTADSQDSE